MAKRMSKGFCIKLTPEDHAVLEAASAKTAQSMSQIVRMLVRVYLAPQLKEGKMFPGAAAAAPVTRDLWQETPEE
jgi:hypothetical protein